MLRNNSQSIKEANQIPNAIKNALDPRRPIEIEVINPKRVKIKSIKRGESGEDIYYIKRNSRTGHPEDCTCKGSHFNGDCRHQEIVRLMNEKNIPSLVSSYRTNDVPEKVKEYR